MGRGTAAIGGGGGVALEKSDHDYATARRLRRSLSLPEVLLWRELRRKAGGVKVRRQHPVGRYVVDFYCAAAKLAFEIDGISHEMGDRPSRDDFRDAFLREQGIEVARIPASEVLRSPTDVADRVASMCRERGG
ncbi:MAG TPA: DUF559 domain-containing protein [Croceibacterium sp.]|nr:DUF559 domain-containing protein [Croceibacterium sp.]